MWKNSILDKLKSAELFLSNIYNSILSYLKILVASNFKISLPEAKHKSCIVLGNGPSLKQTLIKDFKILNASPVICVNNFATAPDFFILKPTSYVILDPGFFILKTRSDIANTFHTLKNKVDWDLNLFIPYSHKHDVDIQFLIRQNSFVKICFYNYVVFKGFKSLAFHAFKSNLAMPQFNNVLGPAILLAINMGYKEINLAGADHSWFEDISINDDNILCRKDVHFYDKETPALLPMTDTVNKKKVNMGSFFTAMGKIFDSYYVLNTYAIYRSSSIFNITENSYIDAFRRKKNSAA
jgi:hypothetical protein